MAASDEAPAEACARRALLHWGIPAARLSFVSARENIVYRVDAAGASFALRIHRPGYHSLAELDSEVEWTRALSDAGVPTPRPVATRHGQNYARVPFTGETDQRVVGLIEWIEGEAMIDVLARGQVDVGDLMAHIGRLIAQMHNQATRWTPSAGFIRPRLDAEALIGESPWWGSFWDLPEMTVAQSQLVRSARDQLRRTLLGYEQRPDNFSLIHSDILPQNMMLRGGQPFVFDFDDCGFGWHVYDLAVALVPFVDEPDLRSRAEAMIAGYRESRAIRATDLAYLPALMLARLMVQLGWMNHRVPVALQASPTQLIPRAQLLAPRIARLLGGCQRLIEGKAPYPTPALN